MKILITGCAGFIGSHLAEFFMDRGDEVIGLDNLSRNGAQQNLDLLERSEVKKFKFYKVDVRNFKDIEQVFDEHAPFDLVIHEAGQVAVTTSILSPREDFEINALGTLNMLEATRKYSPDAFFEYASTNKVYGGMDEEVVEERDGRYVYANKKFGINESQPLDFHSPYGCSKGAADQYVRDYARIYGLKTVVLRQSCIYGTRQFGIEDQGWVAWFTIAAILGKPLTIFGDGKQGRDLLWVDDLVRAYFSLYSSRKHVSGKVYNVGGGVENILSLNELVEKLKKCDVLKSDPSFAEWRHGDQKIFACDISSISGDTGWRPNVSVDQGIEKLINWTKNNKDLLSRIIG